jgi:hypothetical protein
VVLGLWRWRVGALRLLRRGDLVRWIVYRRSHVGWRANTNCCVVSPESLIDGGPSSAERCRLQAPTRHHPVSADRPFGTDRLSLWLSGYIAVGFRLRMSLFIGLIVVPAGGLTFLSLRSVLDEQRSALADVRLRLPAVQAAFQSQLQSALDAALTVGPAGDAGPEVEFTFDLRDNGEFFAPVVLRPVLLDRSAAFEVALRRGERLELLSGDPGAALLAYDAAHALAGEGRRAGRGSQCSAAGASCHL